MEEVKFQYFKEFLLNLILFIAIKIDSTILSLICWIVRALVELSAPKAICGIQRWAKKIFHIKMNWINYAERLALGK